MVVNIIGGGKLVYQELESRDFFSLILTQKSFTYHKPSSRIPSALVVNVVVLLQFIVSNLLKEFFMLL